MYDIAKEFLVEVTVGLEERRRLSDPNGSIVEDEARPPTELVL